MRTDRAWLLVPGSERLADVPSVTGASWVSVMVDPGWTGIAEVLVSGLDGEVRWEADAVVLQLPDRTQAVRRGDLDGLRLCLGRIGVPVVLDNTHRALHDASLVDFLTKLTESGLMVDVRQPAA